MGTWTRCLALIFSVALFWGCTDDAEKRKLDGALAGDKGQLPDDQSQLPQDKGPPTEGTLTPDVGGDGPLADAGKPDLPAPDASTSKHWHEFSYKPTGKLYSVMGTSATNVFAAGQKGLILKYNGTTWTKMTNADTTDIYQLLIHPTSSKWYALAAGTYLNYSGSSWTKGYSSTSYYYNFRGGWGLPNNYVFGVGEMSSYTNYYLSYKSSSSSYYYGISMGTKLKDYMYGIWGLSNSKLWAVGNKGTILKCSGSSTCTSSSYWSTESSGTTSHLRDVHGFSATDIFAVGYDGVILRYDGSKWSKMTTNTATYFQAVWGTSASNVFAVGHPIFKAQDSIFRYDGSKWYRLAPPKTSYCNDVWGASASEVYVVCNFNILKYKGP